MAKSKHALQTVGKILRYMKRYWLFFILSLIFALVYVAGSLYIPYLAGQAINWMLPLGGVTALPSSYYMEEIVKILIQIAIVAAVSGVSQWLMNVCNNKIAYNMIKDVRKDAFKKIENVPVSYLDDNAHGDIVSRVIADVDQFADGLLIGFSQFFTSIVTIIGTIVFMFYLSWVVALVVVVITPLSLFVSKFIASKTSSMFRLQSKTRGEQTAFVEEMLSEQKVVQAYNHADENIEKFDEINARLADTSLKATFFSSITNPATRFVNGVVYAAVALSSALLIVGSGVNGFMSIGMIATFLRYANQYTKPFNEISGVFVELQNAVACAERVFEVIEQPSQTPDAEGAVVLSNTRGDVELDNVCFSYTKDKPLLQNISLSVSSGQRVAIVGATGCGKTTLINLLMRFYDVDSGKICVDRNDTKFVTRRSLRKNFGMVLQDTWLKNATVAENISMGKPDATREEIEKAAEDAHCSGFISQLPQGFDTVLTEGGSNLSQGQRQLLCIARLMLALPPMLILDEATSSIDTRTEIKIQDSFAKLMKGKTSFIVAHRLSTIKEADMILVMKDGNIVERGRHEQLLSSGGYYSELYYSQFAV